MTGCVFRQGVLARIIVVLVCTLLTVGALSCTKKSEAPPAGAVVETGTAISTDGLPIYYTVQGAGEPALVFVHGWCCDGGYWSEQLGRFAQRYKVVAVDLGGHGQSGLERQTWTIEAFGEDVKSVVEKLGLTEAVLVGHSMGGKVIIEAARLMPGRVIGLIGVDTLQDMESSTFSQEQIDGLTAPMRENFEVTMTAFVRGMFPADADTILVARVAADMASAPPEVALSALQETLTHDLKESLQEVKAPIHCINADKYDTNIEANQRMAYAYEVTIMTDVGHFLHMEKPEEFNRHLEEVILEFQGGPVAP